MDEGQLRLAIFLALFGTFAICEWLFPKRQLAAERGLRWTGNLGIQLVNTLVLRLLFPGAAVGMALWAEQQQIGLFTLLNLPNWLEALLAILLLDLAIYAQHRFSHACPPLWRLHRMHHSDTHIDVTTALRFHPIEILLSMLWKGLIILCLGPSALAVLIFEVLLNSCAMFNHANLRLPSSFDRQLRKLIVTPDMHRVHHSIDPRETHKNFGFNLSCWDYLFKSYHAQPALGHDAMHIGQRDFAGRQEHFLHKLLTQPWRSHS